MIVDKDIPVPQWDLSKKGLGRVYKLLQQQWIDTIDVVWSSKEQKAKTTALKITKKLKFKVNYLESLGEMDRSATGYLEPKEFNKVVYQFFAYPNKSIRGWEKANDAQLRIIKAVEKVIRESSEKTNIAVVSHGGVGALLLSKLKHNPISRSDEQTGKGGGNYFVFNTETKKLIQSWKPFD